MGEPVEDLPGALLLDGLLQAFLLGTLVSQVVKYWSDYRDDSWRKRAFVGAVIVLSMYSCFSALWRLVLTSVLLQACRLYSKTIKYGEPPSRTSDGYVRSSV